MVIMPNKAKHAEKLLAALLIFRCWQRYFARGRQNNES